MCNGKLLRDEGFLRCATAFACCEVPVHEVPKGFHVFGAGILVIDVICSQTSQVNRELWPQVNGQTALLMLTMPRVPLGFLTTQGPPDPKVPTAQRVNFLACGKGAKFPDGVCQSTLRLAASFRSKAVSGERVVSDLCGIVENGTRWGFADDRFEPQMLVLGPRNQLVEVGYIGLMVLSVIQASSAERWGSKASRVMRVTHESWGFDL